MRTVLSDKAFRDCSAFGVGRFGKSPLVVDRRRVHRVGGSRGVQLRDLLGVEFQVSGGQVVIELFDGARVHVCRLHGIRFGPFGIGAIPSDQFAAAALIGLPNPGQRLGPK
jgi:hypothetical protein